MPDIGAGHQLIPSFEEAFNRTKNRPSFRTIFVNQARESYNEVQKPVKGHEQMKTQVLSGLDQISDYDRLLKGKRIGLMTNPTGMTKGFVSAVDVVFDRYKLSALFACEHGIRGDRQAGEAINSYIDPRTGVTVHSLYGANKRMTREMTDAFDILVYDIQDVGARFYTYLYSLTYALQACARAGKQVLVLDRINPISGLRTAGTILDVTFASFVGDYALPTRTGLTCGEYALYIKDVLKLDVDLTIAPLQGWQRTLYLEDLDLPWVAPSPNLPTQEAALCYIGTCVFEGVNISEGRGTTQPFQLIGAPFIKARDLARAMNDHRLPGVVFREAAFTPVFSKHAQQLCQGVQLHIVDRELAEPFLAGLLLLETIKEQYAEHLEYLTWDEGKTYTLDKLLGTDDFRLGRLGAKALREKHLPGIAAFVKAARPFLLYE
jgi:uncharacterized protein YbbC (DUF1343 family)